MTSLTLPQLEVLRRMRGEATRPGRSLADAFANCQRYYVEAGFPDKWRLHHQGGMSGYASREVVAMRPCRRYSVGRPSPGIPRSPARSPGSPLYSPGTGRR